MLQRSKTIIEDSISKKDISFLVFAFSLFLLPLSINLSTFTYITAIVLKVIQVLLKRNMLFETKALKHAAVIGLLFFLFIQINSIFQAGIDKHISYFEKLYVHFAVFFITPILLRSKSQNKLLITAFFMGVGTAVLYVFFYALYHNLTFDKYTFIKVLDLHHTYLSMFILAFVNYSIVKVIISKSHSTGLKSFFVFLIVNAFLVMYFLDSKVGMLIFLTLFLLHSLPELSKSNAWYYVLSLMGILIVLSQFINKVTVSYKSALDFRLQIWEVSFDEFEANPLFGNSILPEKDILNYRHYINGKYYFLDSDLNSHNQYLSILMRFGFVGLLILFMYAINVFKKTNPRTDKEDIKELLGFLILILIVCYIENILDRHHGIIFFTVFYNYYLVAIENE